jgi:CDP-diacylglycerol---glycerol-3-phosphate 3-phosphatidyltransferase
MLAYLPNSLTLIRLFLTAPIGYFLSLQTATGVIAAAALFCIAVASDFLDGYISRRFGLASAFGAIMDPIADKVLVLTVLWFFQSLALLSLGIVILVTVREVAVTLLRLVALKKGRILAAEKGGKLKTISQFVAIFGLFLSQFALLHGANTSVLYAVLTPTLTVFFVSAWLSLISGYQFFLGYFGIGQVDEEKKGE